MGARLPKHRDPRRQSRGARGAGAGGRRRGLEAAGLARRSGRDAGRGERGALQTQAAGHGEKGGVVRLAARLVRDFDRVEAGAEFFGDGPAEGARVVDARWAEGQGMLDGVLFIGLWVMRGGD